MTDENPMRDDFYPVYLARERYQRTRDPKDKVRWDAELSAYNSRLDCSVCRTPGHCECTYTPAPHADAHDTTITHFDSGDTDMTMKSYAQHVADCSGDTREAERRFHAETHQSRRSTTVASLRSDAVDEAEQAMRIRHLTMHCRSEEERKEVLRSLAEQRAKAKELAAFRDQRNRFDAGPKCECGAMLAEADGGTCATCRADAAQREMKAYNARRATQPLTYSSKRMDGFKGYHPSDDDGDAA